MRTSYQILISLSFQILPNGRADQSSMAGYIYLSVLLHHFTMPFSRYSAKLVRTCAEARSTATFAISAVHHYLHQLLKRSLSRIPPQLTSRFRWISPKINHIGGTIEIERYLHQHLSRLAVDSLLIFFLTLPVQFKAHITESQFAKLPYGMLLTRSDHEVLRFLILQGSAHIHST